MNPFVLLLIGMAIVIGGVLWLRLHAFLALIIAAMAVAALTPKGAVYRHTSAKQAVAIVSIGYGPNADLGQPLRSQSIDLEMEGGPPIRVGDELKIVRADSHGGFGVITSAVVESTRPDDKAATAKVVFPDDADAGLTVKTNDVLIRAEDHAEASKSATQTIGERVAYGFGRTAAGIGILIAMAAIIGKCLLDSGAADRIVRSALRLTGEKGAPLAFSGSGFLLGIPVFFDTVFYLMMPLGKAMYARTGRNYLLYVLSIVTGGTMAHSLVPPTPGPLLVADQMQVPVGAMILGGCIVGVITTSVGLAYAAWANRRWTIPLRDSPDESLAELQARAQREDRELPPLFWSLLPIVLPVVLIAGKTVVDMSLEGVAQSEQAAWLVAARPTINTLGNKNVALVVSALLALVMLVRQTRASRAELAKAVQSALASGGLIILITAAGGAFATVLRQTDIASKLAGLETSSPFVLLPLAFGITTLVRTAQGSATVAMITAAGVIAPLATASTGFHPLYLALAIGCGSKPISWMNDSGFWVICKMSGLTEAEMLKTLTIMSALMGLAGLGACMVGAMLFPLV